MTRTELIAFIKERAIQELDGSGVNEAVSSISVDVLNHPEVPDMYGIVITSFNMLLAGDTSEEVRAFIEGIK
jgi:hypothetical protein